uniref:Uncharacterized protein n=1 Tax=Chromera velia CCMP2878 TaxID=1169474 RepID=A0A0G4HQR2_9ALVE|eukprot:Cvel_7972.t1-p1 / transcript=Cvel_7972.t1 / gene=Cvel_7972 / organism=Chromera_velia_CCMP2878 / gene_product=hypothetical protein / transcript_product=hypothetical protein / location=Cvel_scaffold429:26481-27698(-) / protein_length=406 / sequence_SO=supercontig / SO=protein_coding / is_pseudo=false
MAQAAPESNPTGPVSSEIERAFDEIFGSASFRSSLETTDDFEYRIDECFGKLEPALLPPDDKRSLPHLVGVFRKFFPQSAVKALLRNSAGDCVPSPGIYTPTVYEKEKKTVLVADAAGLKVHKFVNRTLEDFPPSLPFEMTLDGIAKAETFRAYVAVAGAPSSGAAPSGNASSSGVGPTPSTGGGTQGGAGGVDASASRGGPTPPVREGGGIAAATGGGDASAGARGGPTRRQARTYGKNRNTGGTVLMRVEKETHSIEWLEKALRTVRMVGDVPDIRTQLSWCVEVWNWESGTWVELRDTFRSHYRPCFKSFESDAPPAAWICEESRAPAFIAPPRSLRAVLDDRGGAAEGILRWCPRPLQDEPVPFTPERAPHVSRGILGGPDGMVIMRLGEMKYEAIRPSVLL